MKKMLEMMAKEQKSSMAEYMAFLRGINVGGNNKIGMEGLR